MIKTESFIGYTLGEEIGNAVSHGAGALLAAVGTGVMLASATLYSNVTGIVGAAIYGVSLIALYLFSTLYHAMPAGSGVKKIFRVFDHCSIFFLIWGTYAPVALSLIGGAKGWTIFILQSVCMTVGIVLNCIDLKKYKKPSLVLYICMGWAVVFSGREVFSSIDKTGLELLIGGGIAYTTGIIFYSQKSKKYFHFVWHMFVLAGSFLHYFFVMRCCL